MKRVLRWTWKTIKKNWLAFVGFIFYVVIPLIMLYETLQTSNANFMHYMSFAGCVVVIVASIIFFKRLRSLVEKIKKPLLRRLLLVFLLFSSWGLFAVFFYGLSAFFNNLLAYWWRVGICFIIGSMFYIIHALKEERDGKRGEQYNGQDK